MKLADLLLRISVPEPWAEGEKIPWDDPDFSRRMLREHLSQSHDAASRRFEIIDQQVAWIHTHLLRGKQSRILDLGCGPGLYTQRLTHLGHTCQGLDYSPASIAYAQKQAEAEGLKCPYTYADMRIATYPDDQDLVMLLYGELNAFRQKDARIIFNKAHHSLIPGGTLLLEVSNFQSLHKLGHEPSTWYANEQGLWSDQPYLCLYESFWDELQSVVTERYYIVDLQSGDITRYAASLQAYTEDQYINLLTDCGFDEIEFFPGLSEEVLMGQEDFFVITARKASKESE